MVYLTRSFFNHVYIVDRERSQEISRPWSDYDCQRNDYSQYQVIIILLITGVILMSSSSGLVIKKMELIELASQLSDCTLYCTRLLDLMESAF